MESLLQNATGTPHEAHSFAKVSVKGLLDDPLVILYLFMYISIPTCPFTYLFLKVWGPCGDPRYEMTRGIHLNRCSQTGEVYVQAHTAAATENEGAG